MKKFFFFVFLFIFLGSFTLSSKEETFDETENFYEFSYGNKKNYLEGDTDTTHIQQYISATYSLKYNSSIFTDPTDSTLNFIKGTDYDYDADDNYVLKFTDTGKEKILKKGFKLFDEEKRQSFYYEEIKDDTLKEFFKKKVDAIIEREKSEKKIEFGVWREAIFKQIKLTDELLIKFNDIFKISFFSFTQGKNKSEIKNNVYNEQDILSGEYNENDDFNTNTSSNIEQGKRYFTWILLSLLSIELLVIATISFLKQTVPLNEVLLKTLLCVCLMILITNIYSIVSFASSVFIKGGVIASQTTKEALDFKENNSNNSFRTRYEKYLKGESGAKVESKNGEILIRPSQVLLLSAEIQEQLKQIENKIQSQPKKEKFWVFSILQRLVTWIIFILAKVVLMLSFLFVAIYIMLWQIELKILIIIATFLLPFKIFRYTDFLAKGIWGTLLGQCVKLFTAAFLINIADLVLQETVSNLFKNKEGLTFQDTLICVIPQLLLICGIIAYFVLKIPETARALLIGQPTTDGNAQNMLTRSIGRATGGAIAAGKATTTNPIKLGTGVSGAFAAKREAVSKGEADRKEEGKKRYHTGARTALSHGISTALTYGLIKAGKNILGKNKDPENKSQHPKMDGASNKIG